MILEFLPDIPRFYTGISEWAACMIYILILRPRSHGIKRILSIAAFLFILCGFQVFAGILPIWLWIPGMIVSILLMLIFIVLLCDINLLDASFCCARAFVLAEFIASLEWQIYVWFTYRFSVTGRLYSIIFLVIIYSAAYTLYFFAERSHINQNTKINVSIKELIGTIAIVLAAFFMSNLSFVMENTPFSSQSASIFYVRTLVDFGGLVMLFAQQDKREELRLRHENTTMNNIVQRQYEQYQLARENKELLRREFHDIKHKIIAIKEESSLEAKDKYLSELESLIRTQEALSDTGNSILDAVLTTKSLYCVQNNILFTCMADGKLVEFMDNMDICTIFGNALDNAIESVEKISNPENRLINVSLYSQNNLILMQFENYYEELPVMEGDTPLTTKKDKEYHGYGIKSIRQTAQKYGGTITIQMKEQWFKLQVLIPNTKLTNVHV